MRIMVDMANSTNPTNELDAALRGLGRKAYRDGLMVHSAVTYAIGAVGRDLDTRERLLVMGGWRAERAEVLTW